MTVATRKNTMMNQWCTASGTRIAVGEVKKKEEGDGNKCDEKILRQSHRGR